MPIEAAASEAAADVTFQMANSSGGESQGPSQYSSYIRRDRAQIAWPNVGRFYLEAGRGVRIEVAPGVPEATWRAFLVGPVLSLLLYQRGFLVLHASAVALRDGAGQWGAVGFVGRSGEGKSTMAAALHARGHRVMSDDVIAVPILAPEQQSLDPILRSDSVAPAPLSPLIFPGYPQLRLAPQSVQALGEDAAALPRIYPLQERRIRRVEQGFELSGVPLRSLFVLESGEKLALQRLAPAPALMQLVQHTYCIGLSERTEAADQFYKCAALARTLPIFGLERSRDLTRLDDVTALVENNIATSWAQNGSK